MCGGPAGAGGCGPPRVLPSLHGGAAPSRGVERVRRDPTWRLRAVGGLGRSTPSGGREMKRAMGPARATAASTSSVSSSRTYRFIPFPWREMPLPHAASCGVSLAWSLFHVVQHRAADSPCFFSRPIGTGSSPTGLRPAVFAASPRIHGVGGLAIRCVLTENCGTPPPRGGSMSSLFMRRPELDAAGAFRRQSYR